VEEAPILRKHDKVPRTHRMGRGRSGSSFLGGPAGTDGLSYIRNPNCDTKKRQPISKVHKNGDGHSKVA
jgi:hypothetical protein